MPGGRAGREKSRTAPTLRERTRPIWESVEVGGVSEGLDFRHESPARIAVDLTGAGSTLSPVQNWSMPIATNPRLSAGLAPSTVELAIEIGKVPLNLKFADVARFEWAGKRYRTFLSDDKQGLPIWVDLHGKANLEGDPFTYDLDGSTVRLGRDQAEFERVPHEYSLDSLIRILLSKLLLDRSGFLLHAATVVVEGRAHVFTGRSGAGKSTVASLSPAGSVLTDEISLLRCVEARWQAFGTPFWGEFRAGDMNCSAPIAGIYSLVQAKEDRLVPISPRDALRVLLPNVLFFSGRKQDNDQLLGILTEIVEAIPVYHLHFRRHAAFWEVIA